MLLGCVGMMMVSSVDAPVNDEYGQTSPTVPYVDDAENWGTNGPITRAFITYGHRWRIRQNGDITRVRLFMKNLTFLTSYKIQIWREDGGTFDLVGESEELLSSLLTESYATIDLSNPITGVLEGDYVGYIMSSTSTCHPMYAKLSQASVSSWYYNGTPSATDFAWLSTSEAPGAAYSFDLYMTAPSYVGIGDSLIAGHTAHYSFVETTGAVDLDHSITANIASITGYATQNMGVGAQQTTAIAARFAADCLALNPYYVVVNGGVNDLAAAGSKATFLSNWTSMLTAAQADASVKKVAVCLIAPWDNGSTAQMQSRDEWNADLVTLCGSYSKAIPVNLDSTLGKFREGGDLGNLWDIKTEYSAGDGVHLNAAGYTAYAQAVINAL